MNARTQTQFTVRLAETQAEREAAQNLRYRVFVEELGGGGAMVDHVAQLETDRFDPYFDHMLLIDNDRSEVVGVYRLMRRDQARAAGQFYSEDEYDLSVLLTSGRSILELGRSCVDSNYRGGMAMFHLWNGLAQYVAEHDIEVLFGVASFHGTNVTKFSHALSLLHHRHLAPKDLRVRARGDAFQNVNIMDESQFDARAAMVSVPALIKAYLRLGGFVGEGAYIDHAFNTVDVCLVLDTARMNDRLVKLYQSASA